MTLIRVFLLLCVSLFGGGAIPGVCAAQDSRLLVIIAPDAFHAALKSYVAHKQKQLRVELVSLKTALRAGKRGDDPERLKRYLFELHKKRNLAYALLVGDCDVMPTRYMVLDRVTPAAFDYAFYPSDLYYADLTKADGSFEDWNAQKEGFHGGYYGETRGEKNKSDPINFDDVDYLPEIAVGRWTVSAPEEVKIVVEKSIDYEKRIARRGKSLPVSAIFFMVSGWIDARPAMERMSQQLPDSWHIQHRFYRDSNYPEAQPPDEPALLSALNQGVDFVFHSGHGSERVWEGCYSVEALNRTKNAHHLPVMFSVGCSTAYFAPLPPYEPYVDVTGKAHAGTNHGQVFTQPPPPPSPYQRQHNVTGLGEQLLKGGSNGAVAYIGCNTGSQPCGMTLLHGFVEALAQPENNRLGDCWKKALAYYHRQERLAELKPNNDWYPPSIFFQGMKFMLFGDPSLQIQ
ncbi:MAG: hypothetical protein KIT45_02230 [Fimbriimonadia bacterium]|nr:hypothetical protein [Fimbriimonadia bacterium]